MYSDSPVVAKKLIVLVPVDEVSGFLAVEPAAAVASWSDDVGAGDSLIRLKLSEEAADMLSSSPSWWPLSSPLLSSEMSKHS